MTSVTRRADALRARLTEPAPYPVTETVTEVRGRASEHPPASGWSAPADRHALAGFRQRLIVRPFGKHEQPWLTGAYVNLVRIPNRLPDAVQLPAGGANRSMPRNRPTMDEGMCPRA